MVSLEESLIQLVVVAIGALIGSTFMWLVLGPIVAKRGMAAFTQDAWDLSDEDVSDPKKMMKAITKAQAETFASSIYGALGNITQNMPTEALEGLAGKFGVNPGLVQQAGPLMDMLQGNPGNGTKNPFMGIMQMMFALNSMGGMMGGGGGGGSPMLGMGSGNGGFNPGFGRR